MQNHYCVDLGFSLFFLFLVLLQRHLADLWRMSLVKSPFGLSPTALQLHQRGLMPTGRLSPCHLLLLQAYHLYHPYHHPFLPVSRPFGGKQSQSRSWTRRNYGANALPLLHLLPAGSQGSPTPQSSTLSHPQPGPSMGGMSGAPGPSMMSGPPGPQSQTPLSPTQSLSPNNQSSINTMGKSVMCMCTVCVHTLSMCDTKELQTLKFLGDTQYSGLPHRLCNTPQSWRKVVT